MLIRCLIYYVSHETLVDFAVFAIIEPDLAMANYFAIPVT
jgi:hypothetical protein